PTHHNPGLTEYLQIVIAYRKSRRREARARIIPVAKPGAPASIWRSGFNGEAKMRWRWWFAGHPAVVRAGGVWAVLRQARLAFRLLCDERVPTATKLIIPATLLYLISPLDLIPDIIP